MGVVMVQYSTLSSAWRMLAFAALHRRLRLLDRRSLVHFGGVQGGLFALDVGLRRLLSGQGVVVVLLRHGALLGQGLEPIDVLIGLVQLRQRDVQVRLRDIHHSSILSLRQIGLCLGQLCLGLHELGLILALVEREENLPGFDHLAFVVVLSLQKGLHAGANIHRVRGVRSRGQFGVKRYRSL